MAGIEIGLLLDQSRPDPWIAALFPVVGVIYLAAGLLAWARRPSSRLGLLIVVGGWASMLVPLGEIDAPTTIAVGAVSATLIHAVVAHMLVAFPTGRLHTAAERNLVVGGYVVCLVLQAPLYLFASGTPLTISVDPGLMDAGIAVQRAGSLVVVPGICVLLIRKLLRANPEQQRVLAPLTVYFVVALLYIPIANYLGEKAFDVPSVWQDVAQLVMLALVPIVLVVAASRGGFQRTTDIAELGVWLGADEIGRPQLRDALAATLGDPTIELLFRVPGEEGLVDHRGMPTDGPAHPHGRGLVDVELGGRAVGAIAYDATLIDRPDEIREAGRVIALALERERLTVELRASRARLVAAADGERRRIARDLHDGLQSRLVFLGVQTDAGADRTAIGAGIQTAIDELRELVDGVMPALLTQRGLTSAVEELLDRVPAPVALQAQGLDERPAPGVEAAAYFVVSEAVVNAVKHANATTIGVVLQRTADRLHVAVTDDGDGGARAAGGVRGMVDRVEAQGGEITIDSPAGRGTSVRAVIPCGS